MHFVPRESELVPRSQVLVDEHEGARCNRDVGNLWRCLRVWIEGADGHRGIEENVFRQERGTRVDFELAISARHQQLCLAIAGEVS